MPSTRALASPTSSMDGCNHSLLIELLTDHGVGTMIKREKSW